MIWTRGKDQTEVEIFAGPKTNQSFLYAEPDQNRTMAAHGDINEIILWVGSEDWS